MCLKLVKLRLQCSTLPTRVRCYVLRTRGNTETWKQNRGVFMSFDAYKRKTAKTFVIELYPDCDGHQCAIQYVNEVANNVCFIFHDRDITESGAIKKAHYYIVYKHYCKTNISAIANLLQIEANYIDTCKVESRSLLYCIHRENPEKTQYEPEEVKGKGELYTRFHVLINDEGESDRVLTILKLLESVDHAITMTEFVKMCCEAGVYSELRRGGYLLAQVLREHNDKYYYSNG